jgi:phospho-N-acetylmuramoyl-pentapeptide-transferase
MFYHLLYPLTKYFSVFNVFGYITFRAAYATITALVLSFVLGPYIIRLLQQRQIKEIIRTDGPQTHLAKAGTPSMGGIIILAAIIIPTLLWANLSNFYVLVMLLATVWMGVVGFIDDYLKVVKKIKKGLIARYKMAGQILLGLVVGTLLVVYHPAGHANVTVTSIPFFKNLVLDFGWFYIPFVVLVITSMSNAVNLTDGLDGLAIGITGIVALAFAGFSYVTGRVDFSQYLNIIYLPGSGELTIYCAALIGASLGFLWFNATPAQIFMGDTGALALGGALGTLAVLLKKEFLLVLLGGVFVAEVLSVVIQVISYKWRGKRVFRMAPLHHHFELAGWKESKVVTRFYIITVLLVLLSLSTIKIQ